jgi:capsid assembly protease
MPYPNEHSCRLHEPKGYDSYRRVTCDEQHDGKCIDVIYGLKGTGDKKKSETQALRYKTDIWTEADAKEHCASRKGMFEPAEKPQKKTEQASTISHIMHRLNSMPWAIRPEKLEAIQEILDRKIRGETLDYYIEDQSTQESSYMTIDDLGMATIAIHGTVGRRLNLVERASGGISAEILLKDVITARDNPTVKGILLHIDSPGGMVDGVKALADTLYHARDQKPILAYVEGEMASAAYWLGSAAHHVWAEKTALVGSIGVVATHYDLSVYDEKQGIKRTYIYNGKYKRLANDAEPLSDEGKAYLQGIVDDFYSIFVEDVERQRNGLTTDTILKMESRIYVADKALSQGLIDGIGDYPYIYSILKKEAGIMTKDEFKAEFPDLFTEVHGDGLRDASHEQVQEAHPDLITNIRDEATQAERTRIMGIFTDAYGKDTAEKFGAVIKPNATVSDMMAFAQDRAKADLLQDIHKEAPESVGQEAGSEDENPLAGLEGQELYKAEYQHDPKLREIYGSLDVYIAYKTAEDAGRISRLKKK